MKKTWSSLFEVRPEGKASGHSWEIKKGWKGALLGEEVLQTNSSWITGRENYNLKCNSS